MSHSGFLQFDAEEDRARFVRDFLDAHPEIKRHAFLPSTRPDVVIEDLREDHFRLLVAELRGRGRWFPDVPFRSMGD